MTATVLFALVFIPLLLAFLGFVGDRWPGLLAPIGPAVTAPIAGWLLLTETEIRLTLVDSFGVSLAADDFAAWLLLTNACVSLAVLMYCRRRRFVPFFYNLLLLLHASTNAVFVCQDLFSLYVTIELTTISAFLLIAYPMRNRSMWTALRYLLISNTAMLFFLMGTVLVYEATLSFAMAGITAAPPAAAALIMTGLIVKGGVFIPGLWLPAAHAEAEAPVSALLSGVVVKIGVLPLLKIALLAHPLEAVVRGLGVGGALLGLLFALTEKDVKRLLAFSTLSQIGFILAAPAAGAFYAFSHGLVKSSLFLAAGALPSRSLEDLRAAGIDHRLRALLLLASLSIAGIPFFAGYGAKVLLFQELLGWQQTVMLPAAVGTTVYMAKLVFLPRGEASGETSAALAAMGLLLVILMVSGLFRGPYDTAETIKAGATLVLGWALYFAFLRNLNFRLPTRLERFQDLVGGMCLVLLGLLWVLGS